MTEVTTCQICGRMIKAKSGYIAHHGYKRPHQEGYQTASCFGAGYTPYEVGHNALDRYIVKLQEWIADAEAKLEDYLNNPPASIIFQRRNAWGERVGEPHIFERPADFNAAVPNAYSRHYGWNLDKLNATANGLRADLEFVSLRRANWQG